VHLAELAPDGFGLGVGIGEIRAMLLGLRLGLGQVGEKDVGLRLHLGERCREALAPLAFAGQFALHGLESALRLGSRLLGRPLGGGETVAELRRFGPRGVELAAQAGGVGD
jgi:hypothetical protein